MNSYSNFFDNPAYQQMMQQTFSAQPQTSQSGVAEANSAAQSGLSGTGQSTVTTGLGAGQAVNTAKNVGEAADLSQSEGLGKGIMALLSLLV